LCCAVVLLLKCGEGWQVCVQGVAGSELAAVLCTCSGDACMFQSVLNAVSTCTPWIRRGWAGLRHQVRGICM